MIEQGKYPGRAKALSRRPVKSAVLLLSFLFLALAAFLAKLERTVAQDITDKVLDQQLEPMVLREILMEAGINTLVEIPVSRDTYIASNLPDTNFGTAPELRQGYNLNGSNNGALRTFLFFDIASVIPSQAVINSAKIRVYLFEATPVDDAPMSAISRHLLGSWDENLVTWNGHQPDWGSIAKQGELLSNIGWQESDITEIVRDWHSGKHVNNGHIHIADERVQERQRKYWSLNANNGLYPRLIVDYTVSTDTTPPTASINSLPQWSQSSFTVSWSGSDNPGGSGIDHYDVQYSIGGGTWVNWKIYTNDTSATFVGGQNGVTYQFRARAVDRAGNIQGWTSSQAQTTVDSAPPTASVDPLPEYSPQVTVISWSGSDGGGSGIATYDVEYREAGGVWRALLSNTTVTSFVSTGGQNGVTYEFRAHAVDNVGNVQPHSPIAQTQTTVDTEHPSVSVSPLPETTYTSEFMVTWSGSDNASGIATYDVEYREASGAWQGWLSNTTATSAQFTDAQNDVTYEFRARGVDKVGNVQPHSETAQAQTTVVFKPTSYVLPFSPPIMRHTDPVTSSFTVEWAGFTAPGTTISLYKVRYRFNNEPWQDWILTTSKSATFELPPVGTATGPDGIYYFEVTATNSIGQAEEFTGVPEASIIIDRLPPYVTPKAYLPVLFSSGTHILDAKPHPLDWQNSVGEAELFCSVARLSDGKSIKHR